MQCRNCLRTIPDGAKVCQFCEATVEAAPTPDEQEALREVLAGLPPEAVDELREAFAKSKTAEEFANRILSGECPKCGSEETGTCEDDPEIEDATVSRCYRCGQFWCTCCGRLKDNPSDLCECMEDEEE